MKPTNDDYIFLLDVTERARKIHLKALKKAVVERNDRKKAELPEGDADELSDDDPPLDLGHPKASY